MVFHLDNAHDIDADNQDNLIVFVDRNFIAELPRFKGGKFQNIHWWDNDVLGLLANLKQHARLSEACLVEATSNNDLSVEHTSMSN